MYTVGGGGCVLNNVCGEEAVAYRWVLHAYKTRQRVPVPDLLVSLTPREEIAQHQHWREQEADNSIQRE